MAIDNPLLLSDDDFMRQMESSTEQENTSVIEDTPETTITEPVTDTTEHNDDHVPATEEPSELEEEEQSQEVDASNQESDTNSQPEDNSVTPDTANEIDYKSFYEQVTKEYKAAGKIMPGVTDPKKLIQSLQMATDYALKTAALKPAMKRVKMLDGISDEEFAEMLDFKNRNPEVIKKALKESKIDPIDLDLEDINYVAQSSIMSDEEYDFKEVVARLSESPLFDKTRDVVLKSWDPVSKQQALLDPTILEAVHNEVLSGRFDIIQSKALQLKAFGNTGKMTDLEIYAGIAAEMDKEEELAKSRPVINNTPVKPVVKKIDPELEDKKLRAGITVKKTGGATVKYDPTKLSDAEFMKLLSDGAEFI